MSKKLKNKYFINEKEKTNELVEDNSYMFEDEGKTNFEESNKSNHKKFSGLKVKITSIGIGICIGFFANSSIRLIKNINHDDKEVETSTDKYKEGRSFDIHPALGSYRTDETKKTIFYPGEHTVTIPIAVNNDLRKHEYRFDSHKGYEPIKIFINATGNDNNFAGGYIIYQNDEVVKCTSNIVSTEHDSYGDYIYKDFGKPIYDKDDSNYDIKKGEFDVGEHIISVPIGKYQFDIDYFNENKEHEGYTLVDVCGTLYGDESLYGGAVALYKNTVPIITNKVNSKYESYDNYEEFGYPIENGKTSILK